MEIQDQKDLALRKQLEKVDWNLDYGSVKIQLSQRKITLIII